MLMWTSINNVLSRHLPSLASVLIFSLFLGGIVTSVGAADKKATRAERSDPEQLDEDEVSDDLPPPKRVKQIQAVQSDDGDELSEADSGPPLPTRVIGNGFGTMGRASHLMNRTFGRYDSITPVEYMPYMLTDANFFFADLRGFVTNTSQGGGNLGLGYRRLFDNWNGWAGASVWYDGDHSTTRLYQQIGLSFEALFQQYEFRSNVYLPVTSTQNFGNTITNPTIVGHQLLYTRMTDIGTALRGVDVEAGYSMPVLDKHVVRGFVGGYFFNGSSVSNVAGVKARVEAVINNTVTAQVLYTQDKLYGANVMVGLSMQFPFGNNHPNTGWVRNTPSPFRYVERNYNVIVDRNQSTYANQVATNPQTDQAYKVEQVNSSASGPTPDGTTSNPFSTVAAAQAAGGDIILVQNGSVLNQPITLTSGQYLFGQGAYNAGVPTTGGGIVPMPNLAQSVTQVTPIIQNVSGNAITLASNTQVAGFNIVNPSGDGIIGTGVSNVSLHDLTFSSIGGDAIHLSNPSGSLTLSNLQVNSATGNGLVVSGGNPDLVFNGGGDTITASGNGFVLQNLTGGSVALNNLALTNVGGSGLVIDTVATDVNVNSLNVSQSGAGGSAVRMTGNTGTTQVINGVTKHFYNTYSFTGNTKITSPNGVGFAANNTDAIINVANLTATSTAAQPTVSFTNATNPITIASLAVNNANAMGLYANTVNSLTISGGHFVTVNAPAMDIESSGFNATLGYVNVNGGAYGIKLENSTGTFLVQGSGSLGSGGLIQNTTTAGIILNSFGNTSLNWMSFNNNAVGIQATGVPVLSLDNMTFSNNTGYAIDGMNISSFSLLNSTLVSNGTGGSSGTIRLQANTIGSYAASFSKDNITDHNGNVIQLLTQAGAGGSNLNLQFLSNTISAYNNGSTVLGMNWNGQTNTLVQRNTIAAYGSGMTAMLLENPTTSATMTTQVSSNTIVFEQPNATNGTGIWMINGQSGAATTGRGTLTMDNNIVQFQSTGGTGYHFTLYNPGTNLYNQNGVTDLAGGATGMLFDHVGAGSTYEFLDNVITLLAGDPLTHRGINFTQVDPTLTLLTPSGSLSNWVYNATSTQNGFSIPSGTATGGIIINGNYIVAP